MGTPRLTRPSGKLPPVIVTSAIDQRERATK